MSGSGQEEHQELHEKLREQLVHSMQGIHLIDARLFMQVNQMPHPRLLNRSLYGLAQVMTWGHGWVLALLVATMVDRRRGRRALHRVVPSLWFATMTVEYPIKYYFHRRRPFARLVDVRTVGRRPRSYSFPSGHAASSFGGALLMSKQYPELTALWYSIAMLVGFSRVYLGVHYPGDVVIGALLGTTIAEAARRVIEYDEDGEI